MKASGPRIKYPEFAGAMVMIFLARAVFGLVLMWAAGRVSWGRAIVGVAAFECLLQACGVFSIYAYRRRRFERAPMAPPERCYICPSEDVRVIHLVLCEDDARELDTWRRARTVAAYGKTDP